MLKIIEDIKPRRMPQRVAFSARIDSKTHLEYIYLGLLLKKHGRKIPVGDVFSSIVQNINNNMRKYLSEHEEVFVSKSEEFMKKYINVHGPKPKRTKK
jgi:hypothetical protein